MTSEVVALKLLGHKCFYNTGSKDDKEHKIPAKGFLEFLTFALSNTLLKYYFRKF